LKTVLKNSLVKLKLNPQGTYLLQHACGTCFSLSVQTDGSEFFSTV